MASEEAGVGFPNVGKQQRQMASQSPSNGIGFKLGFAKPGSKWKNVTKSVGRRNPTVIGAVGKIQELTQQEKEAERLETLMQELGPSLQAFDLFTEVNPRLQRRIVDRVQRIGFVPGQALCVVNQHVEHVIFVIIKGKVKVKARNGVVVDTIEEQESFTPAQFRDEDGRSTDSDGEYLTLKCKGLDSAMFEADATVALMKMKQFVREEKLLWKIGIFSGLTSMEKLELLSCMKCVNFHSGESVAERGVKSTVLYLIVDGCAAICTSSAEINPEDRVVTAGGSIGEFHLVRNIVVSEPYITQRSTLGLYLSREELVNRLPNVYSKLFLTMTPEDVYHRGALPQARHDSFTEDFVPQTMEEVKGSKANFNIEVERDALFAAERDICMTNQRVGKSARRYSKLFFGSSFSRLSSAKGGVCSNALRRQECLQTFRRSDRSERAVQSYKDLFNDCEALRFLSLNNTEVRDDVLRLLKYERFKKGGILFNPGEIVTKVYIILSGTINVVFHSTATNRLLAVLTKGSATGMWSAQDVQGCFRGRVLYSAIASDNLGLAVLSIQDYHALNSLQKETAKRRTCLQSMKHLQLPFVDPMSYEMKLSKYPKGYVFISSERIFDNKRFAFILEGEVVVRHEGHDITVLTPGEVLSWMDADPALRNLEFKANGQVLLAYFDGELIKRLDPNSYESIYASSQEKAAWRIDKALGEKAIPKPKTLMDEYVEKKAKGVFQKPGEHHRRSVRRTENSDTLKLQLLARRKPVSNPSCGSGARKEMIAKALNLTIAHYSRDTHKRQGAICSDWVKADLTKYEKRTKPKTFAYDRTSNSCKPSRHWAMYAD